MKHPTSKQVERLYQRLATLPEEPGTPLLDLIPAPRRRGRPKGKRNRHQSGSLTPVVECRKGKTYPVLSEGRKRVPKTQAYECPHHFSWFYQWSEWCGRREKWVTRSRRVPVHKVHAVRLMIARRGAIAFLWHHLTGRLRDCRVGTTLTFAHK